ncbi:MAG: hypothetical protein V9F00_02635 [Nocardioides sp.]
MHWPVGEGFDTPVVTPPCDNCNAGGVGSRKFAVYEAGPPPYVRWAISSRVTQTVGETVVITDTVGDGHSLDCTSLRVRLATSVDAWGHPEFSSNYFNYTVDSCSDTTLQVTIDGNCCRPVLPASGRFQSHRRPAELCRLGHGDPTRHH